MSICRLQENKSLDFLKVREDEWKVILQFLSSYMHKMSPTLFNRLSFNKYKYFNILKVFMYDVWSLTVDFPHKLLYFPTMCFATMGHDQESGASR